MDWDFEELAKALPLLSGIIFHLECIKESDCAEDINTHLDAMQELCDSMPGDFNTGENVRDSVVSGHGDYSEIRQKCIDMGVIHIH